MSLGETIYKLRTSKNMSQGDLADALDVSRQSVSKWENDSAIPDLDKLKRLSGLFQISLDELVNGTPAPTPQPEIRYIQEKATMPGHILAGIILLCCAFITFVAFTILGYLSNNIWLGTILALPFLLTGAVSLLCRRHTGFFCCWVLYIPLWMISTLFMVRSFQTPAGIFSLLTSVLLLLLVLWTFRKLYTGQFQLSTITKWIWYVILTGALVAQLLFLISQWMASEQVHDLDAAPIESYEEYLDISIDPNKV